MAIPLRDYWQLLRRHLAPQRGAALLMAALLLAGTVLQLAGPYVARSFIDAIQAGAGLHVLVWSALLFIGLSLAHQGMRVLATYWSERVAWTATNALRAELAGHLVRLDLGFHKAHTPGELIERVDGDVNALAGFFSGLAVQLAGSILLLAGILGAVLLVNRSLGLALVAFALIAMGFLGRVWQTGTPHWRTSRERAAGFYGYLGELLTATEDLRACAAVPYAMRRFFEHLRAWWPARRRAALYGQGIMMAGIVAFAVGDAMAYGLGGALYRSRAISLGTVYMVLAYVAMLASPIETIRTQLQHLQRADASIARVRELLAIRPALKDGDSPLPSGPLSVEFHGVHFAYQDGLFSPWDRPEEATNVLADLSFRLEPGRVLGVLGRTGSGKTTIARLLFRLYDPQQGVVRLGGVNLRQAALASLRARVGLVTQDVQLFRATLRENITLFDPSVPDAEVLAVLDKLGLCRWFERLPQGLSSVIGADTLSAGEAQLVALARLFLKDPGLIILDEASSRLDPATEGLLERAFDALLAGRTVVVIAHRLATVGRADDILILENGRIVEQGPRRELAEDARSRFARLWRTGLGEVLA